MNPDLPLNTKLVIKTDPKFQQKLNEYPQAIKTKIMAMRLLIHVVASDTVTRMEETLKWGEPSFLTPVGSTLRLDWKPRAPDQFALYFKCTSLLVPAFMEVFGSTFRYEGTRAIVFGVDEEIPVAELRQCIAAALTYHKVKHLPNLGLH
jgi:hypothetical protein